MNHEQMKAYLKSRGYIVKGLPVEEIEVLAGVEGFEWDDSKERFKRAGGRVLCF